MHPKLLLHERGQTSKQTPIIFHLANSIVRLHYRISLDFWKLQVICLMRHHKILFKDYCLQLPKSSNLESKQFHKLNIQIECQIAQYLTCYPISWLFHHGILRQCDFHPLSRLIQSISSHVPLAPSLLSLNWINRSLWIHFINS